MSRYEAQSPPLKSRQSSNLSDAQHIRSSDSSFLHPEDAFYAHSAHQRGGAGALGRSDTVTAANSSDLNARKRREKRRGRSSSRRRRSAKASAKVSEKGQWKKLLWVKQSYPDNYTDEETFLDHLQRNPRLRPYEFWPLVADSTIIVQHVCSVVIFICCFTGIFQERANPRIVVGWATIGTVAGWVLRDYWQTCEEAEEAEKIKSQQDSPNTDPAEKESFSSGSGSPDMGISLKDITLPAPSTTLLPSRQHSRAGSGTSVGAVSTAQSPIMGVGDIGINAGFPPSTSYITPWNGKHSPFSPRMQERLTTAKSAILIYCSLLGLSPILKSLTSSTSPDSIWALSSWLMILNVLTFDYGAGPEAKFPASLSTNAALMASTVLASRLASTTDVFYLTLFSIEVFGLFPVFRRHLRHHSWAGHVVLTMFLVTLASGGLSMVISGGGWIMGIVGVALGGFVTCLSMGMTSWWLIGLQRYKNEIRGPWDPARPVIRRAWD